MNTFHPFVNFTVISTISNIANLFECVAMLYFVKWFSAFRIITEPCADRFPLFGSIAILLHHAFYVSSFGRGKERLVPLCPEMDNCIYGSPKYFACLIKQVRQCV